jgi:uncharacterized Zn-finger protein
MEPQQTIEVDGREVACDGGCGPLGHPRVFLNMGDDDHIDCPYCGIRFELSATAAAASPAAH